jgi:hypothetical protein
MICEDKNNEEVASTAADSTTPQESKKRIEWSPENEQILVQWCDAAQCYKWLHRESHLVYSKMHAWFTIPAIVLSTVSGTASFAQKNLPLKYQPAAPLVIGTLNIFIGILTTIQQYLKISELNESHRVMYIAWDKYARNIRIELSKAPDERSDAGSFLKYNRQEFDRLMETSPSIDQGIIDRFITTFKGKVNTEQRERYDNLKKPDICNIIVTADSSRHPWYLSLINDDDDPELSILDKQAQLKDIELTLREREHSLLEAGMKKEHARTDFKQSVTEAAHKYKECKRTIDEYVNSFVKLYGRHPITEEIRTYFQTYMNEIVSQDNLETYLHEYNISPEA